MRSGLFCLRYNGNFILVVELRSFDWGHARNAYDPLPTKACAPASGREVCGGAGPRTISGSGIELNSRTFAQRYHAID